MPKIVLHDARRALVDLGAYVLTHVDLSRCLHIAGEEWDALAAHWDDLPPDPSAAKWGTARSRRYGTFLLNGSGCVVPQPHDQCGFAPLTTAFTEEPLLIRLLRMLAWLADGLDEQQCWVAGVHPLRVQAAEGKGLPTPEGLHRDGVTLFTALLVNRSNTVGGETVVVDTEAGPVLTTTLVEPGTLVLNDDRRTLHGVSPIRPANRGAPAVRDVLVVTFAPGPTDIARQDCLDSV